MSSTWKPKINYGENEKLMDKQFWDDELKMKRLSPRAARISMFREETREFNIF